MLFGGCLTKAMTKALLRTANCPFSFLREATGFSLELSPVHHQLGQWLCITQCVLPIVIFFNFKSHHEEQNRSFRNTSNHMSNYRFPTTSMEQCCQTSSPLCPIIRHLATRSFGRHVNVRR